MATARKVCPRLLVKQWEPVQPVADTSNKSRRVWSCLAGLAGSVCLVVSGPGPVRDPAKTGSSLLYTEAPRFEPSAWIRGAERFPEGSTIQAVTGRARRTLVAGFFAAADPEISFDARNVLFAGRQQRSDPWQIWEVPVGGGQPVRVTSFAEDCVRPLYLPGGKIVYARKYAGTFQLEVMAAAPAKPVRISYGPGSFLPAEVLRDGRILFEGTHPAGTDGPVELYTVYDDGTGVESLRCDHGRDQRNPHQVSSGDVVFASGRQLGRFTSALARQVDVRTLAGDIGSPIAEMGTERWVVSLRPPDAPSFGLYELAPAADTPPERLTVSSQQAVQPVAVMRRDVPPRHPSSLQDRRGANLLCLNSYESPVKLIEGSVGAVRVYTLDDSRKPALLGETSVESDGSFFIQVPSERPLRIELLGRSGRNLAGEAGWFWMRRGEQRVCVGCHAGPERAPDNVLPKILTRLKGPVNMMPEARSR